MKAKRSKLMGLAALVCIVTALSGCGSSKTADPSPATTSPATTAASETAAPTTAPAESLKLTILGHGSNFTTGWEAVIKDAQTKGFDITVEKTPEGGAGDDILKTRVATKELPDIMLNQSGQATITSFGDPDKNFVDMTNQEWVKNLNLASWSSAFAYQGKVYAAPFQGAQVETAFYNKKLFESLGLKIPTTYEEFLAVCEAIKQAGKVPVYLPGKDSWTLQFTSLFSTAQADSMDIAEKINLNQMKFADYGDFKLGLTALQDIVAKGYGSKDAFAHGYDDAEKAIATGEAGMFLMGSWFMTDIVKKFPDNVNDIGAFAMPFPGKEKATVGVSPSVGLYIMKGSKNQAAAEKFMEYFESIDTQNIFFGNEGGIPEIQGVTKLTLTPAETEAKKLVDDGFGFVNFQGVPLKYSSGDFAALSAELVAGKKTPDQVLAAMDKEFVKQAKSKEDPNFK